MAKKIIALAMAAILCTASMMPALAEEVPAPAPAPAASEPAPAPAPAPASEPAPAAETKTETKTETDKASGEQLTVTTTTTVEEGKKTVTVTWSNEESTGSEESGSESTGSESEGSGSEGSGSEAPAEPAPEKELIIEGEQTTTTETTGNVTITEVEGEETRTEITEDEGNEPGQPEVNVEIIPGETTTGAASETVVEGDVPTGENDLNYDYTETTTTEREVTVEAGEIEITVNEQETDLKGLQSELKFDRNDAADSKKQSNDRDLYADNGHFTNPDNINVGEAPDGYSYKYVGNGDYSGHYVSHIRVIYERDEAGNPIVDENGEYVIKELRHSKGGILTKNGVPTTDINGPFDQTTGTRPQQFLLMDEDGNTVYGYCIDLATGAEKSTWYQVANLEDNNYYASEESEKHVRTIVTNGYWGTSNEPKEDGSYETGSLAKIKEDMKKAIADGVIEKEYDITFAIREKNTGRELQEGEYIYGDYIYKHVTEHIVLTDEVIDAFTEGEALDATQSAIWSYANGSNATLDGTDRMIVGDITYASCAMGDGREGDNDFAGAARTKALYTYLMNLETQEESTIIINEKNNVEDVSITVKDKVADHANNKDGNKDNDVYNTELNFKLAFIPGENDDLLVQVSYTNMEGENVNVIRRLAGKPEEGEAYGTIDPDADGNYTISGLKLSENEDFDFDIRLEGTQLLEQGVYVYTAQGGINESQTFVGMAEGTNTVDISVGMTIKFDVDENNKVVAERKWHKKTTKSNKKPGGGTPGGNIPGNDATVIGNDPVPLSGDPAEENLEVILDEEVPLAAAPETGDNSIIFAIMSMMSLMGMAILGKKRVKN